MQVNWLGRHGSLGVHSKHKATCSACVMKPIKSFISLYAGYWKWHLQWDGCVDWGCQWASLHFRWFKNLKLYIWIICVWNICKQSSTWWQVWHSPDVPKSGKLISSRTTAIHQTSMITSVLYCSVLWGIHTRLAVVRIYIWVTVYPCDH